MDVLGIRLVESLTFGLTSTTSTVMLSLDPLLIAVFASEEATCLREDWVLWPAARYFWNLRSAWLATSLLDMTSHSPSEARMINWSASVRVKHSTYEATINWKVVRGATQLPLHS